MKTMHYWFVINSFKSVTKYKSHYALHYVKIDPCPCIWHPHLVSKKDHIDKSFVPCIIPSYDSSATPYLHWVMVDQMVPINDFHSYTFAFQGSASWFHLSHSHQMIFLSLLILGVLSLAWMLSITLSPICALLLICIHSLALPVAWTLLVQALSIGHFKTLMVNLSPSGPMLFMSLTYLFVFSHCNRLWVPITWPQTITFLVPQPV